MISGLTSPKFVFNKSLLVIYSVLCLLILLIIIFINEVSIISFAYFFSIWTILYFFLDKEVLGKFTLAFLINSFFICIYVLFQSNMFPSSYGTTSPLNDSWTDDSHFFSLLANQIPVGLETREYYFEYKHPFSSFLRMITPFGIYHPLDILFFQSGVMATMAIYTSKFAQILTNNQKVSNRVFYLITFSPFLIFNGGVILIRDIEVATLFILSIYSLLRKNYFLAFVSMFVQFFIREGTAYFILPLFFTFFLLEKPKVFKILFFVFSISSVLFFFLYFNNEITEYLIRHSLTILGRDFSSTLSDVVSENGIFYKIQELNFIEKFFIAPIYIFLYPFFSVTFLKNINGFDARAFFLSFVYPIEGIFLYPLFFAGFFIRNHYKKNYSFYLKIFFIIGFIMLGLISLQTRHKTVFIAFYYYFVALGTIENSIWKKLILLSISIVWFFLQLYIALK
jgi:hypothetical protein